jgi:uncharacterized protein YecT (DUF1311 family)
VQLDSSRQLALLLKDGVDRSGIGFGDDEHGGAEHDPAGAADGKQNVGGLASSDKLTFATTPLAATLMAASMTLSMASPALAQAFDCKRAKLTAEHLICQDKALSSLDLELDTAYGDALDVAADPDGVVSTQRAWLKRRNACTDSACIKSLYKARLHALAAVPHAVLQTDHFPALGIS